jgi:isopentenyldiphosphate isomerase
LGLRAAVARRPSFLTITGTVGVDAGHTDVSLWFVLAARRDDPLTPDPGELHEVRWWSPADLRAADPARFDPHLPRFLDKLRPPPDHS